MLDNDKTLSLRPLFASITPSSGRPRRILRRNRKWTFHEETDVSAEAIAERVHQCDLYRGCLTPEFLRHGLTTVGKNHSVQNSTPIHGKRFYKVVVQSSVAQLV